jgi:hypothetical protein
MTAIPAFCSNCNTFFINSSALGFGNSQVSIKDIFFSCPSCDSMAKAFDGTYTGNIINVILKSKIDFSDYIKFSQIVDDVKSKPTSIEEVSETIKSEIPKLSPLIAFLKHDIGLITILTFIATVIGTYFTMMSDLKPQEITPAKVQEEMQKPKTTQKPKPKSKPKQKLKVNSLCPCGSGRKSKKCCQSKG